MGGSFPSSEHRRTAVVPRFADIATFMRTRRHEIHPAAFGLLKVPGQSGSIVTDTAAVLGIPCFLIVSK